MVFVGERRFLEALSSGNGIYNGADPLAVPISLFFVQATIILGFSTFLGLAGFYLRSPKVIFEIIAGVLLGPSALCRDQWFKEAVFPSSSLDYLSLVANIGLTFYLFIIGIDLDTKLLMTHAQKTIGIAIAGMAVPFAIGIAISQTMIDTLQNDQDTSFVSFFVFIGTAMSITAFPVLARILKEGGMIYTKPGAMTVGAAALNDAIAWCLLALAISIANGGSMNETGYIFGTMVGIAAFQLYVMRPTMEIVVEYAESNNVTFITNNLFAITLCILFMSAWFTELIGLDSIFGAFLFGLTIPRGSRLYRNCKEYIEQFVVTFTLPLYFTLSGLKTDVTLIETGEQGAMIILVCFCATVGKFFGCGMAAILTGNNLRESATIAALMNTRGLVELIVLNVGLSAGILNTRTFSVMVIMCLFTTFITSPLVSIVYPESMRKMGDSDTLDSAGYHPVPRTAVNERTERIEFSAMTKRLGVIVESLPQMQSAVNLLFYFIPHTIGSEFAVTAMHFIEPTKTTRDEFLGLNAEGRLIRVDEEATDFFQAFQYMDDPGAKKPELLPITAYCKANHIPVNAFRIEGDAIEYPIELSTLATINECSLLCFPFRSHNQFARHLFWTSLYMSSSPVLLLLPIVATKSISDKNTNEHTRSREGTQIPSDPEESDMMRTLSSPPLFTNLHKEVLPRHRRNTVTNQFNKVEVSGLGVNQIVVLLVGRRADLTTISLLPRFIENPINEVVVLFPSDYATTFPQSVVDGLNSARESLGAITPQTPSNRNVSTGNIVWRELEASSTDYEGLTSEVNELSFDLFVCSFVEPPPVDLTAAVSSRSARNNRTNTLLDLVRSNEPDHIDLRLQAGMPLQYVYSNLVHPELGIIGSKLYEAAHFKASLVLIVHDPLPMNGRSASIVSDRTEQSQHTQPGVELPQVKPEIKGEASIGVSASSIKSRRLEAVTEVIDEKDATTEI